MKPRSAKRVFLQRLRAAGKELGSLRPAGGVRALLDFYSAERADGCDPEADGDMLLFQWGTYDWGAGEAFELNITRQLTADGEDAEIRQLRLTFKFKPSTALRALGEGNRWCESPGRLKDFHRLVLGTPAFAAVGRRRADKVCLEFGST